MRGLVFFVGLLSLAAPSVAPAVPVLYTVFAITDVSLGGRQFHNAEVYLEFAGDTADVQPFQVMANNGYQITKGTARLKIVHHGEVVRAEFLPDQLVVAADNVGGGAGFSSLLGSDRHLEAAYPLAMDYGTVANYSINLATTRSYSGKAWSCIGFPVKGHGGRCGDPRPFPLKTDHGDFFIFQPYSAFRSDGTLVDDYLGSLNSGFFSVVVGNGR
jgi:hypothetical protein